MSKWLGRLWGVECPGGTRYNAGKTYPTKRIADPVVTSMNADLSIKKHR